MSAPMTSAMREVLGCAVFALMLFVGGVLITHEVGRCRPGLSAVVAVGAGLLVWLGLGT